VRKVSQRRQAKISNLKSEILNLKSEIYNPKSPAAIWMAGRQDIADCRLQISD
jgi:hypothetical protein